MKFQQYVDRGGELALRHPFLHERTQLRVFSLDADIDCLQRICDRVFNVPSGGVLRFRPASSSVLLTFATIPRLASTDERDRQLGWSKEVDVAFWMPVVPDHEPLPTVRWYIPYIFVDNPYAMAGGREIYGLPKTIANFGIPEAFTSDEPYTVDAMSIAERSEAAQAITQRIFSVTRDAKPSGARMTNGLNALRELAPLWFGEHQGLGAGLKIGFSQLRSLLIERTVNIVALRQLRDIANPALAAFQEVVEAPARVVAVHGGGLIPGGFTVNFENIASHPIAKDLGLSAATPVKAAFWTEFDFLIDKGRRIWTPAPPAAAPQKIAVLGGGIASLTTVHELTRQPDWKARYDITVHQTGWRIGGKGASSRNPDAADRIEEHGLHVWFGFYDTAFRMLQECYQELAREPAVPLATWKDAFKPQSFVMLQEEVDGEWAPWPLMFPTNDAMPGDSSDFTNMRQSMKVLLRWITTGIELGFSLQKNSSKAAQARGRWSTLKSTSFVSISALLRVTQQLLNQTANGFARNLPYEKLLPLSLIREARKSLGDYLLGQADGSAEARRLWISLDFALTNLIGILNDDVMRRGFESLDEEDYVEWLARHGASKMTQNCPPVRAIYDIAFAYRDGDINTPDFAAGAALYGVFRMLTTYKGAFMWKMQAGMGEVVFTPVYEVLKRRGVKFQFFSRVENLGLSADGRDIDSIRVARQATLKNGTYQPLVRVKGIDCWPNLPLFDQLVEGEAMREAGAELESSWSQWPTVETMVLQKGRDFDLVVLGISLAALPKICGEIIAAKPEWQRMIENVRTVSTLAFQVWMKPDRDALGWSNHCQSRDETVQGTYVEPIDTYADMSWLIAKENWPADQTPGHLAYFCGPLDEGRTIPFHDPRYPETERRRVRDMVLEFFKKDAAHLWPQATKPGSRELNWDLMVDPQERQGEERLDAQYLRANVEPTDRYVLSVKGSTRHRLRPDQSGVNNLFLCGDWTRNGYNVGCIEAAAVSGLQCARAIVQPAHPVKRSRLSRFRSPRGLIRSQFFSGSFGRPR